MDEQAGVFLAFVFDTFPLLSGSLLLSPACQPRRNSVTLLDESICLENPVIEFTAGGSESISAVATMQSKAVDGDRMLT